MTVEFDSGVNQTVVFRCRHERPDAIIGWELNETSSRLDSNVVDSFIMEMGVRIDTLTVPVIPTYNNTEVVCSAFVDGNTEDSPAATLTFTSKSGVLSVLQIPVCPCLLSMHIVMRNTDLVRKL